MLPLLSFLSFPFCIFYNKQIKHSSNMYFNLSLFILNHPNITKFYKRKLSLRLSKPKTVDDDDAADDDDDDPSAAMPSSTWAVPSILGSIHPSTHLRSGLMLLLAARPPSSSVVALE